MKNYIFATIIYFLYTGFAFLVHVIKRMLFLPTWVVAVAMVFLFFYDIFMVFITPFMTKVEATPTSHTHSPV